MGAAGGRSVPGVVVPVVEAYGVSEAGHGLVQVLVAHVLVPAQRVGVREARVQLQRPLEELERRLVLLLQREAVAHHAPALRRAAVQLHHL